MSTAGFARIDRFPFSRLMPGNKVIAAYMPDEGRYAGRRFVIDHYVPDERVAKLVESVSDMSHVPGKALYTFITEVSPDGKTREVEQTTREFERIFREAIEGERATVMTTPQGILLDRLEDLPLLPNNVSK